MYRYGHEMEIFFFHFFFSISSIIMFLEEMNEMKRKKKGYFPRKRFKIGSGGLVSLLSDAFGIAWLRL